MDCLNLFTVDKKPKYTPILTWEKAVHRIPWGIIILLGGGFALAEASKVMIWVFIYAF